MNWFTKSHVSAASLEKKKSFVDLWGGCDHVEADPSLLHIVSYENDPWGREGICLCKECCDKADEEEANEDVICHDCKKTVKRRDTIPWRWYDFNQRQGDNPLTICTSCATQVTHLNRIQKDRNDYEAEMSRYGDM